MAMVFAREYVIRGYRNTGYSAGSIDSIEFDRPLSKEVFESLYPDGDSDILELQETGSKFLLRTIYNKPSVRIKHTNTQKDLLYQVDYLRIKAVQGGADRECAYYFVDTARTEWIGSDTAVLYLTLDEQTTANATQVAKVNGIIEKRNIEETETDLNWFPEDFTPSDPLQTSVAYVTAESGTGYTVRSGIAKTTGVKQLAAVFCDLGQLLGTSPVVAPLPDGYDKVTFNVEGSDGVDFSIVVEGMALVDVNNSNVKKALNKLRELGNESMIGSTYNFPLQCLKAIGAPYTSHGVDLIISISGGSFSFTIDNLNVIPTYGGIYSSLVNKKAGYQFTQYSLTAPATNDTRSYTLQEIIESVTGSGELTSKQLKFIGTGVPMSGGAMYWRPAGFTTIDAVTGYDNRIVFLDAVRGSDWNNDGLTLTGMANAPILANQLSVAQQQYKIDQNQVDRQFDLTKANIDQARAESSFGLVGTLAGGAGKGAKGVAAAFANAIPSMLKRFGIAQDAEGSYTFLGDTYNRQEDLAEEQAKLAKASNTLGLKSVQFGYNYAKSTQSLAVQPPTGLDQNRIMGSSLMVMRKSLTPADVIRYELYLTWRGTTVQERFNDLLKNHEHLFDAGESFSYLKLGMCTISLPNDKSGWANSLAWRRKIQSEMQTGGRYWKTKILDYVWKAPIPEDGGYTPVVNGKTIITSVSIAPTSPEYGDMLLATINPTGANVTYKWYVDGVVKGTSVNYEPTVSDIGKSVHLVVTGTGNYTGTKTSNSVTVSANSLTSIGINDDTPQVGDVLSYSLVPSGATATIQWYLDNVASGTGSDFEVTSAMIGKKVKVSATGTGGYTGTVTSAETSAVTSAVWIPEPQQEITPAVAPPETPTINDLPSSDGYTLQSTVELANNVHYLLWTKPGYQAKIGVVQNMHYEHLTNFDMPGNTTWGYCLVVNAGLPYIVAVGSYYYKVYSIPSMTEVFSLRNDYMGSLDRIGRLAYENTIFGNNSIPWQYTPTYSYATYSDLSNGHPLLSSTLPVNDFNADSKDYKTSTCIRFAPNGSTYVVANEHIIYDGSIPATPYSKYLTSNGIGFGAVSGVTGICNFAGAPVVIDGSAVAGGSHYINGLYYQTADGKWHYRYTDGSVKNFTDTPLLGISGHELHYGIATDGKLYRICG